MCKRRSSNYFGSLKIISSIVGAMIVASKIVNNTLLSSSSVSIKFVPLNPLKLIIIPNNMAINMIMTKLHEKKVSMIVSVI